MHEPSSCMPAMPITPDRWEQGSHHYLPDLAFARVKGSGERPLPERLAATAVGSGRIALGCVLAHGAAWRGWRRLWVPSYFCEDVMTYLADAPVAVARYVAGPWGDGAGGAGDVPLAVSGDVLLRVNYFGWGLPPLMVPFAGEVIEDHTHDPLAGQASRADFAIASLRKVLPLADGGLFWSPADHDLPQAPPSTPEHETAVLHKLAAMTLKRAWLQGVIDDGGFGKEQVRRLELLAEQDLLRGVAAPISDWSRQWLERLSLDRMNAARARTHVVLRASLDGLAGVRVLGPPAPAAPAMAVLALPDPAMRDVVRTRLIANRIYPAVLWPIPAQADGAPDPAHAFSATVLMLHVDSRYSSDDMRRVASVLRTILDDFPLRP